MLLKLAVLLAVCAVVRTCDDVNTLACGQLDRVLNVCTDPCFSDLCQRYCGKCPVKCYQCVSGTQINCAEIVECPNIEYACIHERFLTNNFTVGHKRGCVHQRVCSQLYGTACQSAGECRDQRGFCCKSDLCNKVATSQRTGRRTYNETDRQSPDQRRTSHSNGTVCHDIDQSSCDMIKNSNATACSLPCFQQACPRTCGVCVECSSCHRVDHPEHCNKTTVCGPDEKCYTLKTRSTEGTYSYNLGCLHQKGCDTLNESAPHVLGRSDSIDITVEGHCCSGNLCNQVKPVQPITSYGCYGRSFTWKDCVPMTTARPYVFFMSVSVSPSPMIIPGNITIGVQGTVRHNIDNQVRMNVRMDKLMLGQWTRIPGANQMGSCNYDGPCDFLSAYRGTSFCSDVLSPPGLPCTCPFNPFNIDIPPTGFKIPHLNSNWRWLLTGKFRVRAELIYSHDIVGCLEFEIDIRQSSCGGFLFG